MSIFLDNKYFPLSPREADISKDPPCVLFARQESVRASESSVGRSYPDEVEYIRSFPSIDLRSKTLDSVESLMNESLDNASMCSSTADERSGYNDDLFRRMESEDRAAMSSFLQNVVRMDTLQAIRTADVLVKNGVGSLPVLCRRLKRNDQYLLEIGIDEAIAQVLASSLLESCAASRPAFGPRVLSPDNSADHLAGSLVVHSQGRVKGYLSVDEVAGWYYEAAYCAKADALDRLLAAAAVDLRALHSSSAMEQEIPIVEAVARGFVMRMYALGQGGVRQDRAAAASLGRRLLPVLLAEAETSGASLVRRCVHFLCGVCFSEGLGVARSEDRALGWYKQAADPGGYALAQAYLGFHYYNLGRKHLLDTSSAALSPGPRGRLQDRDAYRYFDEAVRWYRLAADQGCSPAECNLGMCCEQGHGVSRSAGEAVQWYRRAAAQGNAIALYNLALWVEQGVPGAVVADGVLAERYLRQSAAARHLLAQHRLGERAFLRGEYAEAVRWYEACLADGRNYAPAQCALGVCHEHGLGVRQDVARAMHFYALAAAQEHATALYYLGYCHFMGYAARVEDGREGRGSVAGVAEKRLSQGSGLTASESEGEDASHGPAQAPHLQQALELYRRSASLGHAAAQNNLGYCFFRGLGVRQDYAEAVRWYHAAAVQGYAPAQYNLAHCYEKGLGLSAAAKKTKTNEMLRWYRAAAAQGNDKARKALDKFR